MNLAIIVVLSVTAVVMVGFLARMVDRRRNGLRAPVEPPHGYPVPWWVGAMISIAAIAGMVAAVVAIAGSISDVSRDRSAQLQRQSDTAANCRSLYRADIDAANDNAADAESQRIDAFSDVILQSIANNVGGVMTAGQRLSVAKVDVAAARIEVREASAAYAAAVKLSASDQRAFLSECARRS